MTSVTTYTELIRGIQVRIGELGIRQVDFDKLAGFPDGLSGKVFGPSAPKRLGPEKLFDAMRAAGLKLRLEPDPEQLAKMQKQIAENCLPRQENQARMGNSASRISPQLKARVYGYFLKEARKNRWAKTSAKERSEHARMMAMAGVRKRRKAMKRRARQRKAAHKARLEAASCVGHIAST